MQSAAKAIELATELAAQPPIAVAGVLRAVVGAEHVPLEDASRIERDAVHRCSSSADQFEGMTAFLEKRRTRFDGRYNRPLVRVDRRTRQRRGAR